jgi:hypothetical protein
MGTIGLKPGKDTDPSSSMWRVVDTPRPLPPRRGVLRRRAQPLRRNQNAQGRGSGS